MLDVNGLAKTFTLHLKGGVTLPVFADAEFTVGRGQCLVLDGPSGSGKSSLLRCVYGNYRPQHGIIRVRHDGGWVDLVGAEPRTILGVRQRTMGFVSQFLRVIPRISALDLVSEPLLARGVAPAEADERARALLARLNLPQALWSLPPATFSGGEQQRINIARSFIADYDILLLDEPTASLDAANRRVVIGLIHAALARGAALLGIFHDTEVRDAVATHRFDVAAHRTPILEDARNV